MRKLLALIAVAAVVFAATGNDKRYQVFGVAFYNLENFFDTINNNGKYDYEYTENGSKKWDGEKWNYEKIPTSAADFVGVKISHKSQTEHFRRMRKLLQDFVKADSEHYRVIRGSKEEGLYWSVEVIPEKTQDEKDLETAKQEEQELLQKLRDTDYIAVKIAEGAVTEEEASRYEEIKAQRQEWRDQVNALRASQETLTAKIAEANA